MTHRSHSTTTEVTRLHGGPASQAAGSRTWTRRRVLLLNATYEPLSAVTVRRAVVLILRGRADTVHADESGGAFHSPATAVPVPTVIRLRTYVRVPYRATVPLTRSALMHRDRFRCGYCGRPATTIDHVVPRSRGGAHNWENCVACCASCNHLKADRLLGELGWSLRTRPIAPRGRHWGLIAAVKDIHPAWMQYIDAGAA
ncbi:HNH endonuclease [Gordonia amicalis]|uniref:HNH endonuclease n=1 Tax=Gordonia amicalis TaxID=89053 RepID=UPI000587220E|nr:HNH endonuclease [Gordonia amicalis]MBA5849648.1 HNH endonuclease [Gordonia amicalis]MDV7173806.1 HNH endonuclease [Gordonia amicalis]NKX76820.1 HNH endonuclease [Gordonia amicalis]UKO90873.1 HNH endonuclease [Gordonia amicalis]UOG22384.1 HNH endonuclease [Gordonia amicalis]